MSNRLGAAVLALGLGLLAGAARAEVPAGANQGSPLQRALILFKEKEYARAIPLLEEALRDPEQRPDAVLLLGISRYRTSELTQAEKLLREAARSPDPAVRDAAQLFLGLVYDDLGATDQAHAELDRAARSPAFAASAQRLLSQRRSHRLQISLLVAPEYDGNVPLTEYPSWRASPADSSDADFLFLGAISARPFRFGLSFGNTTTYRQQITLRSYSLLLNSTWLGYSYAGPRDRVRAVATLGYSMLGSSSLYVDFDGRIHYRRALRSQLGIAAGYELRHRDYLNAEYEFLTGQTHTGQLELGWGTSPMPILFNLGYQVLRDQLRPPESAMTAAEDFRSWAHGPLLRGRARLHERVELSLTSTFLHRVFDHVPEEAEEGGRRVDLSLTVDASLTVRFGGYFEAFLGGSFIYNNSNKALFHYLKPSAYLGIAAYFGLL
jgi:tetratricopeptide (TPR) repeat protein